MEQDLISQEKRDLYPPCHKLHCGGRADENAYDALGADSKGGDAVVLTPPPY